MIQRIEYDSFNKMNHTIRVSGNILVNLNGQSNVMKNGVKKVGELNNEINVSKSYLSQMINKQNSDKKIIIFFGFFFFMIILFVLIYRIYQKFKCIIINILLLINYIYFY